MDIISDSFYDCILGLGGHIGGQNNRILSYMKIEFRTQRREMLLFLSTNMVTVTSCANKQLTGNFIKFAYEKPPLPPGKLKIGLWKPCKVL